MKALLKSAVAVLSMLIAAAWISGCVIHAHHVDSDDSEPARAHKAKPAKAHKAKPPEGAKAKPAEEDKEEAPKPAGHNPPMPPPPSNTP